jgi:hypothetical protein
MKPMDVNDLVRQIQEAEERLRNALNARYRSEENVQVEEQRLSALQRRLHKFQAVSEQNTDPRQLLNG